MSLHPHTLAFVYFLYLAGVGVVRGHARARRVSLVALLVTSVVSGAMTRMEVAPLQTLVEQGWRLLLLLGGYRAAGAFYEQPAVALERRLLAIDRRLFTALGLGAAEGADRASRGWFARASETLLEAAYSSVYLIIPAGAGIVLLAGSAASLDRFWTTVLAAGFVCYGALPWVQTRPPRAVAPASCAGPLSPLRRLNLRILDRGSVGVNTLPSGHAATATAVALSVWSAVPAAGPLFAALAILIALATVAGRYHYAVDTVLGVLVGVGAWMVSR